MQFNRCYIPAQLLSSNQLISLISLYNKVWNNFMGHSSDNGKIFYIKKTFQVYGWNKPIISGGRIRSWKLYLFLANIRIMNLAVNNQEFFKQIFLHVVLIQGISTFSQNNYQPFMSSEKCILAWILSTIYSLSLKSLINKKTNWSSV